MISAGELNKPVKLRTMAPSRDAAAGPIVTTVVSTQTYWAGIRPASGREFERLGVQVAEVTHAIRMRYFAATVALKPKDSILFGTRVFEIVSKLNPEEANVYFDLLCKEVVN